MKTNVKRYGCTTRFEPSIYAEDVIAGALYGIAYDPNYQVKSILLTSGLIVDALIIPIGLREHGVINAVTVVVE